MILSNIIHATLLILTVCMTRGKYETSICTWLFRSLSGAQWMACLPSALDVIGLNPVRNSKFVFVPRSWYANYRLFVSFGWNFFFPLGTPSLAEPLIISSVLETISRFSYLPTDVEITLEANPTSAETGQLRYFVFVFYFYSIL